jgi:photosystem II stability/assembly factor-like uncharacterized protein
VADVRWRSGRHGWEYLHGRRWKPGYPPSEVVEAKFRADLARARRRRWWPWAAGAVLAAVLAALIVVAGEQSPSRHPTAGTTTPTTGPHATATTGHVPTTATPTTFVPSTTPPAAVTWRVIASPAAPLAALACPGATSCVAVGGSGSAGAILATTDGGTAWSPQTPPAATPALAAVACPSASECLAVGGTSVVETTDAGRSWKAVTLGTGVLKGIACPSVSTCVAVGDVPATSAGGQCTSSGESFTTTDAGTSWSTPTYLSCEALSAVACTSSTSCVAAGSFHEVASGDRSRGMVVQTLNAGGTWTRQYLLTARGRAKGGTSSTLAGVACPTATTCEAVGTSRQHAYNVSTDGGTTWARQLGDTPVGSRSWDAVACGTASTCVAVGASPPVYLSVNGRWRATTLPAGTGLLDGAACPTTTRCVAVGQGPSGGGTVAAFRY